MYIFAHLLLRNNELCRPNCLCHHSSGVSIALILLLSWVPLCAWPFSISISTSLALSQSIPPSLTSSFFIIFQSFELFYARHPRHYVCLILWMPKCLGSIMFQTQVWGSWYLELFSAQSKGLSVIEFVHVKDLRDLCKIMNSCSRQILSLRFLHFEFDLQQS